MKATKHLSYYDVATGEEAIGGQDLASIVVSIILLVFLVAIAYLLLDGRMVI